jgi:hypothetical protein
MSLLPQHFAVFHCWPITVNNPTSTMSCYTFSLTEDDDKCKTVLLLCTYKVNLLLSPPIPTSPQLQYFFLENYYCQFTDSLTLQAVMEAHHTHPSLITPLLQTNSLYVRYDVVTALTIKNYIHWHVISCSLI